MARPVRFFIHVINAHSTILLRKICPGKFFVCIGFAMLLGNILLSEQARSATVYEWTVGSESLEAQTTAALLRYYSVIRKDSLLVRYLRQNRGGAFYTVRAEIFPNNEAPDNILLLSLGQLRLYPSEDIRIAVGEDLYEELLASRNDPTANSRQIDLGDSFGHYDWRGNYRVIWSIWDRLDVRVGNELNAFIGFGAPESNLDFWADGTGRIGAASPLWEFALLFPFSSGGIGFGPLPERLLLPAYGASAALSIDGFTARIRFSDATDETFNATRSIDRSFVHSLSASLTGKESFTTEFGSLGLTWGAGLEEFTEVRESDGELQQAGYVRRISPIIIGAYTTVDDNIRFSIGLQDLALRPALSVRLSSSIWIETRAVFNGLFRDEKIFEHPYSLFLTPRVKF